MGFAFLVIRVFIGGYLAWEGARRLSAYGRHIVIEKSRARELTVVVQGLLAVSGGVCIATGIGVPAGVAATVLFFGLTSFRARGFQLVKRVAFAIAATMLLAIPRPWPYTFVE